AYKWYELGHKRGHFASVWQRSLYNVNGLKAQPWWTPRETGYTELVKRNWKLIRDEGLMVMDKAKGLFLPEDENLREKGDWSQFTLWQQGPTNCRLRMHLGLVIPKEGCKIRCANETRTWEEGKVLIFDDSFEHEVWQDASSFRLIFIVDMQLLGRTPAWCPIAGSCMAQAPPQCHPHLQPQGLLTHVQPMQQPGTGPHTAESAPSEPTKHSSSPERIKTTPSGYLSGIVKNRSSCEDEREKKEWLDERVQGMDVPGLVDKMNSSKAGRKAILGRKYRDQENVSYRLGDSSVAMQGTACSSGRSNHFQTSVVIQASVCSLRCVFSRHPPTPFRVIVAQKHLPCRTMLFLVGAKNEDFQNHPSHKVFSMDKGLST
ncbi:hypothetical protein A6R68_23297, partial [Neotoma lepida]